MLARRLLTDPTSSTQLLRPLLGEGDVQLRSREGGLRSAGMKIYAEIMRSVLKAKRLGKIRPEGLNNQKNIGGGPPQGSRKKSARSVAKKMDNPKRNSRTGWAMDIIVPEEGGSGLD